MTYFEHLVYEHGVHITDIARLIGISKPTAYRKIYNNSFTYDEMITLRNKYFKGINIEELFGKYAI